MSDQEKEEDIFHTARDIGEPRLRSNYLDQACQGDERLRARIKNLLEANENEVGLLESCNQRLHDDLPETVSADAQSDLQHQVIDRYKILQQIGEGGMGTVFMAEQSRPVSRRVALKIIKPGMDSKGVIARFEAERQALAMMDHPNIAKVLDAGTTEDKRPYFVMELVKGVPITQFCDENKLPIRQRLELFIRVCQAVQHAHQKGIIHRDIKPSNVLVAKYDDQPVPKVIDFGVAKAISQKLTEKTMFTQYGQIVGTLEYMSPEQAQFNQLDVDTRSDIYSLGVLLYELLTGETPFDGKRLRSSAFEEVLRILREEEPPRPSNRISTMGQAATQASTARSIEPKQLGDSLKGDLDWIAVKALEKDRQRRYETANSLAEDLRSYLNDAPVTATPPSAAYQIRKYVRRNRTAVGIVGVLFAAMSIAVLGLGYGYYSANSARQALRVERDAAKAQQKRTQDILSKLKDELINKAFDLSYTGQVETVRSILDEAKEAGADETLCKTILGTTMMHGDQMEAAVDLLDSAHRDSPDRLATVCAASTANLALGQYERANNLFRKIGRIANGEGKQTDHDRLIFAQAQILGARKLEPVIEELDGIVLRHPSWGVARIVRAFAMMQNSIGTGHYADAERAMEEVKLSLQMSPNNPYVLRVSLQLATYMLGFKRRVGDDTASTESLGNELLDRLLTDWPDMLEGRFFALNFLQQTGQTKRFHQEATKLVKDGWAKPQPQIVECLRLRDSKKLQLLTETHKKHTVSKVALGIDAAINGDSDTARRLFEDLQLIAIDDNTRMLALDIAVILQDKDLLHRASNQILKDLPSWEPQYLWRWEIRVLQATTSGQGIEELLEESEPFDYESNGLHYAIAGELICDGKLEKAKHHLQRVADSSAVGWWNTLMAPLMLALIEEGHFKESELERASHAIADCR